MNSIGEQKGVDSLIVTDMINLARNRAMSAAVLLSGDEDLRVGVQQAQELGVRVHLLGIKPSRGSQSQFLLQESDSTHEWSPSELSAFLSLRQTRAEPTVATNPATGHLQAESSDPLVEVAELLAREIERAELPTLVQLIKSQRQTPKEIDARLLAKSRGRLGVNLNADQKKQVRAAFLKACEERLSAAGD